MVELERKFCTRFDLNNLLCRYVNNSAGTRVLSGTGSLLSYADGSITYELYALAFLHCLNSCVKSCVENLGCQCCRYLSLSCNCLNKF